MIKRALKWLSYLIFPRRCDLCAEVICLDEERCPECKKEIRISDNACEKCANEKEYCHCDNNRKPPYKAVAGAYYFEGSIIKAVHRFKLYGYKELAVGMGREMADVVNNRYNDISFDSVTFVPMTKGKKRKRGYNQSELLARAVSQELDLPFEAMLSKIRKTEGQRGKSARERKVNLFGAFDLKNGMIAEGKTILLVDDVKTTGSTLAECTEILKAYGAKDVYCVTFAVAKNKKPKRKSDA